MAQEAKRMQILWPDTWDLGFIFQSLWNYPRFHVIIWDWHFHDLILLILKLALSRVVNRSQNAYIPPLFLLFWLPPLLLPWRIYASRFTCTGRPCGLQQLLLNAVSHSEARRKEQLATDIWCRPIIIIFLGAVVTNALWKSGLMSFKLRVWAFFCS